MARSNEPKNDRIYREPSLYINDAMDYIGYSKESISSRRTFCLQLYESMYNDILLKILSPFDIRMDRILTGSKAEGITKMLESDVDQLIVYRNFLCVDDGHIENDITVVKTHMTDSPPGYTRLIPLNIDSERISSLLHLTTVYDLHQGLIFILSSNAVALPEASVRTVENFYDGIQVEVKERSGPSTPMSMKCNFKGSLALFNFKLSISDVDIVLAMPYFSATILKSWSERARMYGWPPHDVINDVSTMEGYVVPVGPKFCEEQNFEWRISYTTAENRLVSSLNAVQLKLYVLMKMLFKQIIKNECDFISSFMIKTVIFWVCERTHTRVFTPDRLLRLLCQVISFLLQCLNANFLPNYIIPSSNLLLGKGSSHERMKLRRILRILLNNGGLDVFRLEKLSIVTNVIMKTPTLGKKYGEWRDQLENVARSLVLFQSSKSTIDNLLQQSFVYDLLYDMWKDPRCMQLTFSLLKLLNVDWLDFAVDSVSSFQHINNVLLWHLS